MDRAAEEAGLPPLERDRVQRLSQAACVELLADEAQDEVGLKQRVPDHVAKSFAGRDGAGVEEDIVTGEAQGVAQRVCGKRRVCPAIADEDDHAVSVASDSRMRKPVRAQPGVPDD